MASQTTTQVTKTTKAATQSFAKYCAFCHHSGRSQAEYTNHWVKEKKGGKVTCPLLKATECGYCKCKGHTPKHCPRLKSRATRRKAHEARMAKRGNGQMTMGTFMPVVQKQIRQKESDAQEQKRARARCSDNSYAALMGVHEQPKRKPSPARAPMAAPKPVAPKAPQGVWGKPAKAAAAVKDMSPAEVEQLKQLLITMGVMGAPAQPFAAEAAAAQAIAASAAATTPAPDAVLNETEQAFIDEQIEKQSQTLEETADGEAFFDNVADAEDAVIELGVPGNPPAISLPDACNLDADFGTPQHGVGGWGDDGWDTE